MEGSPHRIGNLVLDVELGVEEGGQHALIDRVRDLYLSQVLPVMDRLLGELAAPDEVVRLDSLTIDVGDLEGEDWEKAFVERCIAQMAKQLKVEGAAANEMGNTRRLARPQWLLDQFIAYLEQGQPPVANGGEQAGQWLLELLATCRVATLQAIAARAGSIRVVRRLAYGLAEPAREALLAAFGSVAAGNPTPMRLLAALEEALGAAIARRPALRRAIHALRIWIWAASASGQMPAPSQLVEEARTLRHVLGLTERRTARRPSVVTAWAQLLLLRMEMLEPGASAELEKALVAVPSSARVLSPWRQAVATAPRRDRQAAAEATSDDEIGLERQSAKALRPEKQSGTGTAAAVPLAGLVLLHPFLPAFFEHLELLERGRFRDAEARFKAVQLLHWLATGHVATDELALTIPKLLCGLPPADPTDAAAVLTAAEEAACAELLEQVLAEWATMSGSSPEGLQEAFLRRDGCLEEVDGGWRLRVEGFLMDALLADLPWGLSLIRLPWSGYLVFVEW